MATLGNLIVLGIEIELYFSVGILHNKNFDMCISLQHFLRD